MARSFNGSIDYIKTSNIPVGVTTFTIISWIKPAFASSSNIGSAILDWTLTAGDNSRIYIRWENASLGFYTDWLGAFGGSGTAYKFLPSFSANELHHIGFTYAGANTGKYYWDGAPMTTTKVADNNSVNNVTNYPIYIGSGITNNYGWSGNLAEVAVCSVALTANEMLASGKGISPSQIRPQSLVGYWPLYGLASTEPDLSGNKNNGTVTGAVQAPHPSVVPFMPLVRRF